MFGPSTSLANGLGLVGAAGGALTGGLMGSLVGPEGFIDGAGTGGFAGMAGGNYLGGKIQSGIDAIGAVPGAISNSIGASTASDAVRTAKSNPQQFIQSLVKVHPQLAQVLNQAYQENPDKYDAMLFSASQNPELRKAIVTAHQSINNGNNQGVGQ